MNLSRIYQIIKDPLGAKPKIASVISGGTKKYNPDPISKYLSTDNSQMGKWDPVATYNISKPSQNKTYTSDEPKSSSSSSKKTSGGAPEKYDAAGHITEAYKKYQDAQNASSGGGSSKSSSSAVDDAEKAQIAAEKRAEEAQIEAEKRAEERAAQEKADEEAKIRKGVESDWDNTGDYQNDASKELDATSGSISGLGAARDEYLKANEENLSKKKAAIAGNKQLITENQKTDLEKLAEDVRKGIFSANRKLGVMGAGDSSAVGEAAKAMARSGGRNQQTILKGYGDEISGENQKETNALDMYNLQRDNAYKWEEKQRGIAEQEFKLNKDILDKLKEKAPDWKKEDIDNMQTSNLNRFISQIGQITQAAKSYRDVINSWVTDMTGNTNALNSANIDIDSPAALDTPEFSDELNLGDNPLDQQTSDEDFVDPELKKKQEEDADIMKSIFATT